MLIRAEERIRAPEFPGGLAWINSVPLTMAGMRGKAVLVDFWNYACDNCISTLPYTIEWHRRYAPYGLNVVGVHTPEFDFERDAGNVARAVRRFGIGYPVVLDNGYDIWTRYANRYWPHVYLVDGDGVIVYDHVGEGDYEETELQLQTILAKQHPGACFPAPFLSGGVARSGAASYRATSELYLGYERGRIGNRAGYNPNFIVMYEDAGEYEDGLVYAQGAWENRAQSLRHARPDAALRDHVAVRYHARSVNAVIRPAGEKPFRVYVQQDGVPVVPDDRGEDLHEDDEGRTFIEVEEPRMYRVIDNRTFGEHVVRLSSVSVSFDLYAFTFGTCEAE